MSQKPRGKAHIVPTARISQRPVDKQADFSLHEPDEDDPQAVSARDRLMTIGHHLEELRRRILISLAVLVAAATTFGFFINDVHEYLTAPYRQLTGLKLFLGSVYASAEILINLSVLLGLLVTLPIILVVMWGFAAPAVSVRTARMAHVAMAASALLFWGGVAMCWFYVFPVSLAFLFGDLLPPGTSPQVTLEKYYDFVFMLHIGSGMIFQMPLIIIVLGALGIVGTPFHRRSWRLVLIGLVIFAAIATPPDPLSQLILGAPLLGMYALSVFIVWLIEKRRARKHLAEMEEE